MENFRYAFSMAGKLRAGTQHISKGYPQPLEGEPSLDKTPPGQVLVAAGTQTVPLQPGLVVVTPGPEQACPLATIAPPQYPIPTALQPLNDWLPSEQVNSPGTPVCACAIGARLTDGRTKTRAPTIASASERPARR